MLLLVSSLFGCNSDSGSSTSQPPMSLPEEVLPDEPEIEAPIPELPVPEFPDISKPEVPETPEVTPPEPSDPVIPEPPVPDKVVARIALNQSRVSLAEGELAQVKVIGFYNDETQDDLTSQVVWNVENADIVNIDERGVITAVKTGVSVIRADLDEFSSEMTVQVVDAKLTNIYFDVPHKAIAKGLSFQAKAYGEYTDKQTRDISHLVKWDSTDCSVVMPGTNGIFTALEMPLGTYKPLVVMGTLSDGEQVDLSRGITWHVDNDVVEIVDNVVKAKHKGTALVTAALDGVQSEPIQVQVTDAILTNIEVTTNASSVAKGNSTQLSAQGVYSDESRVELTEQVAWWVDNQDVLQLEGARVKGLAVGQAMVYATKDAITSAPLQIQVTNAVLEKIHVHPSEITLEEKNVQRFYAYGEYSDETTQDVTHRVTWRSSNKAVLDLIAGGLSNSAQLGSVTISASLGELKGISEVKVVEAEEKESAISICPQPRSGEGSAEACLMVASDEDGRLFTAPPSVKLMNKLGYELVKPLSYDATKPKTYVGIKTEDGTRGPEGDFAMFNQYGRDRAGLTSQYANWCHDLSVRNFAGRDNWHRATRNELFSLYRASRGSVWDGTESIYEEDKDGGGFGWPANSEYWSTSLMDLPHHEGVVYDIINLHRGRAQLVMDARDPAYASCVSDAPGVPLK
ncbi:Ig-like domain-containing protein [Vibrio parahaemolyticus]|uniref:Ig-like domain-containing protein n=1 Tax=Vibrio parahaemolyticus TaxID=670 RepID=UPI00215E75A1|nr:Ig-like domain-containing protein [Vibrio parahaemolyticus]MCS0070923.1 Ig-like domain-containing protein [Vibrio parahaemolyticus]MCS0262207.1 Ig-like domain-containing protein [Vibrio parahaemolyticus]